MGDYWMMRKGYAGRKILDREWARYHLHCVPLELRAPTEIETDAVPPPLEAKL